MSRRVRSESAWNQASARSSSVSLMGLTYNQVVVRCQGSHPPGWAWLRKRPDQPEVGVISAAGALLRTAFERSGAPPDAEARGRTPSRGPLRPAGAHRL